jgi:hypothetical protein
MHKIRFTRRRIMVRLCSQDVLCGEWTKAKVTPENAELVSQFVVGTGRTQGVRNLVSVFLFNRT